MATNKTAHCKQCGNNYQAKSPRSLFCSGACRAKFSRLQHSPTAEYLSTAHARRNATKAAKVFTRQCRQCGATFELDGRQGKQIYCSLLCKKRAWIAANKAAL